MATMLALRRGSRARVPPSTMPAAALAMKIDRYTATCAAGTSCRRPAAAGAKVCTAPSETALMRKKAKHDHTAGRRRKSKRPAAAGASDPGASDGAPDTARAAGAACTTSHSRETHTPTSTAATSPATANKARRHEPVPCAMPTTKTGASAQPRLPEIPCAA